MSDISRSFIYATGCDAPHPADGVVVQHKQVWSIVEFENAAKYCIWIAHPFSCCQVTLARFLSLCVCAVFQVRTCFRKHVHIWAINDISKKRSSSINTSSRARDKGTPLVLFLIIQARSTFTYIKWPPPLLQLCLSNHHERITPFHR